MTVNSIGAGTASFSYQLSLYSAAKALADRPEAIDNPAMQDAICRKYGIFLNQMTEDERNHLFSLADNFIGR